MESFWHAGYMLEQQGIEQKEVFVYIHGDQDSFTAGIFPYTEDNYETWREISTMVRESPEEMENEILEQIEKSDNVIYGTTRREGVHRAPDRVGN